MPARAEAFRQAHFIYCCLPGCGRVELNCYFRGMYEYGTRVALKTKAEAWVVMIDDTMKGRQDSVLTKAWGLGLGL